MHDLVHGKDGGATNLGRQLQGGAEQVIVKNQRPGGVLAGTM